MNLTTRNNTFNTTGRVSAVQEGGGPPSATAPRAARELLQPRSGHENWMGCTVGICKVKGLRRSVGLWCVHERLGGAALRYLLVGGGIHHHVLLLPIRRDDPGWQGIRLGEKWRCSWVLFFLAEGRQE